MDSSSCSDKDVIKGYNSRPDTSPVRTSKRLNSSISNRRYSIHTLLQCQKELKNKLGSSTTHKGHKSVTMETNSQNPHANEPVLNEPISVGIESVGDRCGEERVCELIAEINSSSLETNLSQKGCHGVRSSEDIVNKFSGSSSSSSKTLYFGIALATSTQKDPDESSSDTSNYMSALSMSAIEPLADRQGQSGDSHELSESTVVDNLANRPTKLTSPHKISTCYEFEQGSKRRSYNLRKKVQDARNKDKKDNYKSDESCVVEVVDKSVTSNKRVPEPDKNKDFSEDIIEGLTGHCTHVNTSTKKISVPPASRNLRSSMVLRQRKKSSAPQSPRVTKTGQRASEVNRDRIKAIVSHLESKSPESQREELEKSSSKNSKVVILSVDSDSESFMLESQSDLQPETNVNELKQSYRKGSNEGTKHNKKESGKAIKESNFKSSSHEKLKNYKKAMETGVTLRPISVVLYKLDSADAMLTDREKQVQHMEDGTVLSEPVGTDNSSAMRKCLRSHNRIVGTKAQNIGTIVDKQPREHVGGNSIKTGGNSVKSSGNSKTADGNSKTADGNSKTTDRNSKMAEGKSETADRKSETADGNSKIADGNSKTAYGNSATADGNSETADGNSKIADRNSKTSEGNSEMMSRNKKSVEGSRTEAEGNSKQFRTADEFCTQPFSVISNYTEVDSAANQTSTWSDVLDSVTGHTEKARTGELSVTMAPETQPFIVSSMDTAERQLSQMSYAVSSTTGDEESTPDGVEHPTYKELTESDNTPDSTQEDPSQEIVVCALDEQSKAVYEHVASVPESHNCSKIQNVESVSKCTKPAGKQGAQVSDSCVNQRNVTIDLTGTDDQETTTDVIESTQVSGVSQVSTDDSLSLLRVSLKDRVDPSKKRVRTSEDNHESDTTDTSDGEEITVSKARSVALDYYYKQRRNRKLVLSNRKDRTHTDSENSSTSKRKASPVVIRGNVKRVRTEDEF